VEKRDATGACHACPHCDQMKKKGHLPDLDEEHPCWWEEFSMVPMGLLTVRVAGVVGSVGHGREFRQGL